MPVEHFTKADFEAALHAVKPALAAQVNAVPAWTYKGVNQSEHCYAVRPYAGKNIHILIRSSVGPDGHSAGCGEDSIRVLIVDADGSKIGSTAFGRWTTRLPGWQRRTGELILKMADVVRRIEPCPHCHTLIRPNKVSKAGDNKGRPFLACSPTCPQKVFIWLDEQELGETCGGCGANLVQRTAGEQATRPGEEYIACPRRCQGAFRWVADEPHAPATAPAKTQEARTPPKGTERTGRNPGATGGVSLAEAKRIQADHYHNGDPESRAIGHACADPDSRPPAKPRKSPGLSVAYRMGSALQRAAQKLEDAGHAALAAELRAEYDAAIQG